MRKHFLCFFRRNRQGQQMMEHLLVITAVVVVIIFFTKPGGVFMQMLDKVLGSPEIIINRQSAEDIKF